MWGQDFKKEDMSGNPVALQLTKLWLKKVTTTTTTGTILFVTCSLQVLFDLLQVLYDYLNLNKRQMENLT